MTTVKKYLSLVKFSHTIFAMPFAIIGFFLGYFYIHPPSPNGPGWHAIIWGPDFEEAAFTTNQVITRFLLVIGCMVFARSAAMAFNRYLDRSFDAKNPRTAIREIPSGILKANSVLLFTIVNCILFIVCTYFINRLCF